MSSSAGQPVQFEDVVEYRSKNDLPTSKRSRIVGIDTLLPSSIVPRPAGTTASSERAAETCFKWRGKGWLLIASSRWHILGCSATAHPADSPSGRPEWALTSFEKTAFTPAGLDIYSRTPEGLPAMLLEEIIHRAKALGGDVGKLAEQFFEVGRSAS
ncbi:uncharacterized protein LAESUDRAFT_731493 [Laetiporus sulphureus 93-53]|uniref:Uncharacterized protein n=1 Tax=Laetiporus sulphureus 93-53 TaxID=1314785 RepID=A0A165BIP7_9APHY|nr:uncharacterized protein LAESUDRAFT_731493 [Laetiporus sulphureus 93-53]KZT01132.1 hypothetical protein LAESUDRAFT_731493 [Laetiporus sulphureus 93-53]